MGIELVLTKPIRTKETLIEVDKQGHIIDGIYGHVGLATNSHSMNDVINAEINLSKITAYIPRVLPKKDDDFAIQFMSILNYSLTQNSEIYIHASKNIDEFIEQYTQSLSVKKHTDNPVELEFVTVAGHSKRAKKEYAIYSAKSSAVLKIDHKYDNISEFANSKFLKKIITARKEFV